MENQSRRQFLKLSAMGAGASLICSQEGKASPDNILSEDRFGVLVDTTVCVGCRNCEWACKDAHNLPNSSIENYNDRTVFKKLRRPTEISLTVVNEFKNKENELLPVNVKFQCMHCDKPACVSACIVGAISKLDNGAVVWDGSKCIGCRYCMVACPFQIPTFEYQKAIEPEIRKCDFCINRTKNQQLPACVEICPVEALTYGQRPFLVKEGRDRIKRNPDNYLNYIYGEREVGGTGWIYLAGQNFNEIGFPKLSLKTAPGVSEAIQHGIFAYFVPPVLFYSILGMIMWINKRSSKNKEEENHE